MKNTNLKIKLLGLSLILLVSVMAGCAPGNTNMRNMSTQTRLNDNANNRWMDNAPFDTRNRLNTNLNNGMLRNNTNLNNGMVRDNTPMTNDSLRDNVNFNNGMLNNTNISNNTNLSNRATAIAKRVEALPEVTDASVVINGNTAIVGCDVKGNANNTISTSLRQKIEAAVRVADKDIRNISITADPTISTRLRTMSRDIESGNPLSNFAKDIEDILRRITTPAR